jgi:hypothetical protein
MTEQEIMDEIDVAAGYGLAALCLQVAIATKLGLRGTLSRQDLVEIATTAEEAAEGKMVDASEGAVLIAQSAIRALAQPWRLPDKPN